MTVETDISIVSFEGDDVTVAFPLGATYFFYDETDLVVYLEDETDGSLAVQTITTHYTVSGGGGSTGTVTMVTAPTSTQKLWVQRVLPITQLTNLQNNGLQEADIVELMSDKLTAIAQQLDDALNLTLRAPITEDGGDSFILPPKSERAGKYLAFDTDDDATPIARTPQQVVLGPALAAIQPLSPSANKLIEYISGTEAQLIDTSSAGGGLREAGAVTLTGLSQGDFTVTGGPDRIQVSIIGTFMSSATADLLIQIGNGTPVATGYQASSVRVGVSANSAANNATGFVVRFQTATAGGHGIITLVHLGSNLWSCEHVVGLYQAGVYNVSAGGGYVDAGGVVDTVRVKTTTGTFAAGAANCVFESAESV